MGREPSVLDQKFVAYTTAFRVHPARRGARRDAGASQAPRNDAGGLGRPPEGSLFPPPRGSRGRPPHLESGGHPRWPPGASGRLDDAPASPAPPLLPRKREKRSQGVNINDCWYGDRLQGGGRGGRLQALSGGVGRCLPGLRRRPREFAPKGGKRRRQWRAAGDINGASRSLHRSLTHF